MLFTYLMSPPSATTTLSEMAEWATPIWNEFWPWGRLILAIGIPLLLISMLVRYITHRH